MAIEILHKSIHKLTDFSWSETGESWYFTFDKELKVTLHSFWRFLQNGKIKMDTKGTEIFILENATDVLSKMKPIIICETLFNTIELELEKIMRSFGYDFYNHVEDGLRKVDTIFRKKDDGIRNCFFIHPSKYDLIEEFVVN